MKNKLDKWWLKKTGRKLTRKGLVKKADEAFSKFIRARDKKCVTCGKVENLTCGHLFSRVAYSTRWSEKNAFCQCMDCNLKHEYCTYPFNRWFIRQFGLEVFDELYREHQKTKKFRDSDLAELIEIYKCKLKNL